MTPRVALFTDTFHETNGVALTCRKFEEFARARSLPFFSLHPGPKSAHWREGSVIRHEIAYSPLSFAVEADLKFDLMFWRRLEEVKRALRVFAPDWIHITAPGHCSMLGAIAAHQLQVPLAASWHTNVHEFGAKRLRKKLAWIPDVAAEAAAGALQQYSLDLILLLYRPAKVMFAPNPELTAMLKRRLGRPAYLMKRGVDTEMFSPAKRTRSDGPPVIGFAGRLTPEKDVRLLYRLSQSLRAAGAPDFRIVILGQGSEQEWLARHLPEASLPGVLKGESLAEAFANLDIFVFPSRTDTFGNVVQEAMASGVPPVVSNEGGPKYIVEPGVTGLVAPDDAGFHDAVLGLLTNPSLRRRMAAAARRQAEDAAWGKVFEQVYRGYGESGIPRTGSSCANVRSAEHAHSCY